MLFQVGTDNFASWRCIRSAKIERGASLAAVDRKQGSGWEGQRRADHSAAATAAGAITTCVAVVAGPSAAPGLQDQRPPDLVRNERDGAASTATAAAVIRRLSATPTGQDAGFFCAHDTVSPQQHDATAAPSAARAPGLRLRAAGPATTAAAHEDAVGIAEAQRVSTQATQVALGDIRGAISARASMPAAASSSDKGVAATCAQQTCDLSPRS